MHFSCYLDVSLGSSYLLSERTLHVTEQFDAGRVGAAHTLVIRYLNYYIIYYIIY